MNFEQYDIKDFLMDESFFVSVKDPNSEEGLFWKSWLSDHPEKIECADQARKILSTIEFRDKTFSKREITDLWDKIKEYSLDEKSVELPTQNESKRLGYWRYLKVAAVLLPFIIATVLFLFFRESPTEEVPVVMRQLIEKYNPNGQKLTVFLSDGSKVKLNGDTKIKYLKPFNEQQRLVHLEGEAFFEVATDKNRPFIVKSGNFETKVLGTSFDVLAYPQDDNIIVAVRSGKVAVKDTEQKIKNKQNSSILLSPMEMAIYSKKANKTEVSEFDPIRRFGWSEGILFFENASIEEFEMKLERWYGVGITVKRERPIAKGITGIFQDQSLEEILMGTKDASQFEYQFDENGNVIIN